MELYIQPVRDVFQTNAYFYINEKTGHGCLIDPGAQPELLLRTIAERGWQIDQILLTHGHFDHTGAVAKLIDALNIPYYLHKDGLKYLQDDTLNLAKKYQRQGNIKATPTLIATETTLNLAQANINLQVYFTPGHSFDSITYYDPTTQIAFVGDLLYNNGPGIWNFPGGDKQQELRSIQEKLCVLPPAVRCFNGHTDPMTIEQVRQIVQM